ncbi:MAG: hypothetical protein HZB25_03525 [Candidatus Eisenbacteria bacterium]|nr:hypothetical protein [Candidatus Eisenbacteria bacterium]
MSKFVRIALLVALGAMMVASAAFAVVPDPTFSSCGTCIVLSPYGANGDPGLLFTVVVNDQFNNPINGSNVVVDFGTLPVTLCSSQEPGFTAVGQTVAGTTNLSGTVSFSFRGWGAGVGSVKVYADGVQICTVGGTSTDDLNGDAAVDVSDLAIFTFDQISFINDPDMNCDGLVDVSDLAIFTANQTGSPAPYCP